MKKNKLKKFLELFRGRGGDDLPLMERANTAEWLESRLHLSLTNMADDMFGHGYVTRDERKILSGAIGAALDSYHGFLTENAPQLFERSPWEDAPKDDGQSVSEGNPSPSPSPSLRDGEGGVELVESGDGAMFVPLIERAVRRDGTIPIKIIQPGWGSSGYYPAEVLERDGPKIFTRGTKMYWNHQTPSEEAERPEGDLNALAAELVTDARYQSNGPAGAGLYADAKVFENYKPAVDDLAPHIGVSIRAYGKATQGKIENREGPIIQELTKRKSVDFVTAPGAGGQIISLFEAAYPQPSSPRAKGGDADKKTTSKSVENKFVKEKRMDEKVLNDLQESVSALKTDLDAEKEKNARLSEALTLRDAKDMVSRVLVKFDLPEATKARLLESLPKGAPMKEGALDGEAFEAKIAEAVQAEVEYLTKAAGLGKVRGLGSSGTEATEFDEADVDVQLEKAFAGLGLSESGAKLAASGR